MAMTVVNAAELESAGRKNVPLRRVLEKWLQTVQRANWQSLADVRRTFPSADGVIVRGGGAQTVATVFNVKGNDYRIITVVNYSSATVLICQVLTHAEYSKERWKERL